MQAQSDNIFNGLLSTRARQTIGVTRRITSSRAASPCMARTPRDEAPWLRSVAGLRADAYRLR